MKLSNDIKIKATIFQIIIDFLNQNVDVLIHYICDLMIEDNISEIDYLVNGLMNQIQLMFIVNLILSVQQQNLFIL